MSFPVLRPAVAVMASVFLATAVAQAPRSPTPPAIDAPVSAKPVVTGLDNPWGMAFLPDGRMIVTEQPGRVRIVDRDGRLSEPLTGVPQVYTSNQAGLLDVTLSPNFASDNLVYLSFSEPGEGGAGTAVARARMAGNALDNLQVIWRQVPKTTGPNHWGSRLVFARDGTLFVTTGDRFTQRDRVQDLSSTIGKVVRINADGSIPADNPFAKRDGARPEIWSYGHRNIQGAAIDPATGELWTVEHGARGGDELNRPQAGRNYGWPVITYGVDYSGVKIGEGTSKAGMEQPVYYWDPVIAPSGALFYTGDRYPGWKGSLFVGSLNPGALVRLELVDGRVRKEERYLGSAGRVRDIVQGPDGLLYLVIDQSNGSILRIDPGK